MMTGWQLAGMLLQKALSSTSSLASMGSSQMHKLQSAELCELVSSFPACASFPFSRLAFCASMMTGPRPAGASRAVFSSEEVRSQLSLRSEEPGGVYRVDGAPGAG